MILERAELTIKDGHEDFFAEMMQSSGSALLASAPGCHSIRVGRGVENPAKFILLLEWETVEHHIALTKTDTFAQFRQLAAPHVAGAAHMEHFSML